MVQCDMLCCGCTLRLIPVSVSGFLQELIGAAETYFHGGRCPRRDARALAESHQRRALQVCLRVLSS